MSMSAMKSDGGLAFPVGITATASGDVYHGGQVVEGGQGMTMRQYYKAAAMPSLLHLCTNDDRDGLSYPEHIAKQSAEIADAMIAEDEEASS